MKAILINVKDKTVTEVEVVKGKRSCLDSWYKHIGCTTVTTGHYLDESETPDCIMVDDEGLLTLDNNSMFFHYDGGHQPFAGNGLVVGIDDEGDSVSPKVTVDEVKSKVTFLNLYQVRKLSGVFD